MQYMLLILWPSLAPHRGYWYSSDVVQLSRYLVMDQRLVDGVVSQSILERAGKHAVTLHWYCVPPEERLLHNTILYWVAFDDTEFLGNFEVKDDSSNDENLFSMVKYLKLQATNAKKLLAPANRFETLTTSQELASYLEGFVPANTEANTERVVKNFKAWADRRLTSLNLVIPYLVIF